MAQVSVRLVNTLSPNYTYACFSYTYPFNGKVVPFGEEPGSVKYDVDEAESADED